MKNREWTFIDKTNWEDGPWKNEPDKIQWSDVETGMPCLAVRHRTSGHWCGYVGVAPDHPAYGKPYSDVDVEVHGGLTFSGYCEEGPEAEVICHVPGPGEPDNLFWFGFDCHHFDDLGPGFDTVMKKHGLPILGRNIYRTLEYVKRECASLARQLAV